MSLLQSMKRWNKQVQRVLDTAVGLVLSYALLLPPLDLWGVALLMMALSFLIELLVVRHYALAAAFITPLTILLAEAATLGQSSAADLIRARFLDTVLGCLVGFAGGACLHNPRFRTTTGRWMLALAPAHLRPHDGPPGPPSNP
ncbi:FUSC family protein [uncultured Azohydromonas sp.]|jgi:Predicted membrane protein|uniref:FUSC family protein n=1 Tax=uncultured Azohydromonas sp. TaxID=487342 RepID=UPI00260351CF|nr:FUSC family protein [uncultured Azohydromonas sp.]